MRTFIAVDISQAVRDEALRIQELWKAKLGSAVGWSNPDNLHVTLKFLGEVQESQLSSIQDAIRHCTHGLSPFEVLLTAAHAFPNPRRPRVLVVNTESEHLVRLADCLDVQLESLGFPREHRRFHGHLTLGRVREGMRVETYLPESQAISWPVTELVLYQSHLSPNGSCYEALAKFSLV